MAFLNNNLKFRSTNLIFKKHLHNNVPNGIPHQLRRRRPFFPGDPDMDNGQGPPPQDFHDQHRPLEAVHRPAPGIGRRQPPLIAARRPIRPEELALDLQDEEQVEIDIERMHRERPIPEPGLLNALKNYWDLRKIRETVAFVATVIVGYMAAPAETFDLRSFTCCILGTSLLSFASFSYNEYVRRRIDQQNVLIRRYGLRRRAQLLPHVVYALTLLMIISACVLLYYCGNNMVTVSIAAAGITMYAFSYKPRTAISLWNTCTGCIVYAYGPFLGWAASTSSCGAGAFSMAAIIYCWSYPRAVALIWERPRAYAFNRHQVQEIVNPKEWGKVALAHAIALLVVSLGPPLLGLTNWVFACTGLLTFTFIYITYEFYVSLSRKDSKMLYLFSDIYLLMLMVILFTTKTRSWEPIPYFNLPYMNANDTFDYEFDAMLSDFYNLTL